MKFDIPTTLLICYLARLLYFGASIGDAIALTALTGLFGFIHFLNYKKEPEINAVVKQDIEALRREVEDCKKTVGVFKLGTRMQSK